MTYQVLAVVAGSLIALSAFASPYDRPGPPEDANYAPSVSVRAQ